ncbi:MAG: GNAT family N-acetyltransferase [Streptosporangiaceae bacterium]
MSLAELAELAARSRLPWVSLAGTGVRFAPEVRVAVAPQSRLGPPGWTALVSIAGEVIATAPDPATADTVQQALAGLPAASVTDAGVLASRLNIAEILGPATLAYLDAADFRRRDGPPVILAGPTDLDEFIEAVDPDDRAESGIEEITSPAFAVWEDDQVCAAAGYRDWPGRTAHLSVLTGPWARDRGLARVAASAAVTHALAGGLLPQWRARSGASRHVALALGFRELGAQATLRLRGDDGG